MNTSESSPSSPVVSGNPFPSGTRQEKSLFISSLKPKDTVRSSFLVRSKDLFVAKNGKPYLSLLLADKTGTLDCRAWEGAEALNEMFQEGDIVAVGGKTHFFQNRLQLTLDHLVPIPPEEIEWKDYLPSANEDLEALYQKLLAVFRELKNPWIRTLGLSLLEDPEIARRYKICPAAKTIHHAFIGGLLTHSMQLIRLVDAVVPLYKSLDRDTLVFGAAFHDFGKIYELSYEGKFGYTDEGRLVGHIAIATTLIDRKVRGIPDFPLELELHLKHLILSHHGKLEHGSPKRPHTLEAEVLHWLDHMDSRIDSIESLLRTDASGSQWSGYHKVYDQYYFKPTPFTSEN